MMALARVHLCIVMVASSYLTLGVFESSYAREFWAPYAVVMFMLAVVNLLIERKRLHAGSS